MKAGELILSKLLISFAGAWVAAVVGMAAVMDRHMAGTAEAAITARALTGVEGRIAED